MLIFVTIAVVLFIVVLRELARRAVLVVLRVAPSLPPKVTASRAWARSQVFRFRMAERYPAFVVFVANRIEPRQPTGLPLTLMILAAVYLAALFSGLTEDILEPAGIIGIDNVVNAAFGKWRVERQDHPGAWPSWTLRAPGHEGTRCWYAATRTTAHDHQSEIMPK